MANVVGIGQFFAWDGGCLFIGTDVGVVPVHAHHATQVVFGSEPGVRLRPRADAPWATYRAALVPSHQPHALDATGVRANAVMFVEPETREGRALAERAAGHAIAAIGDDEIGEPARQLFDTWRTAASSAPVVAAAWRVIHALTRGVEPSVVIDERILRAVGYIKSHLDAPLTLEQVAAEAFLSPSRFRHLFVEQTGMALRPYILWRRFLKVWELAMAGESLSAAAHGAGFADAAHFTRTCRRMFGIAPSGLQVRRPSAP